MEEQKALGNAEFKAGNYEKAIGFFTKAIELEANHVLYSNRSAAHAKLGRWREALDDGKRAVSLAPNWGKAYSRCGVAALELNDEESSYWFYAFGLKRDPAGGDQALRVSIEGLEGLKTKCEDHIAEVRAALGELSLLQYFAGWETGWDDAPAAAAVLLRRDRDVARLRDMARGQIGIRAGSGRNVSELMHMSSWMATLYLGLPLGTRVQPLPPPKAGRRLDVDAVLRAWRRQRRRPWRRRGGRAN